MNIDQFEQLLTLDECEFLDFKKTFYVKERYVDLLTDVLAFANAHSKNSKYIVCGVKEELGVKELVGLDSFTEQSIIEQLIFENIEPFLSFKLHSITYLEKRFHVIEMRPEKRPYLLKKKYSTLNKGYMKIRRGATNDFLTRADLDRMYNEGQVDLHIIDGFLYATKPELGSVELKCRLSNQTNKTITIVQGCLEIYEEDTILTKHILYGIKDNLIGADFQLKLTPKDEIISDFHFSFSSTQCFPLAVEENGVTKKILTYKVIMRDADDNEYTAIYPEGFLLVKGDFLWKVKLKNKS
ncbi:putative DNA binding domain-containing protein [Rummeliibacillus stabekisii]|uniref:AlbA family DNA-binding domain-containing protein n=1 Tax=Rummeliibacillus stabekisii TaxID=241244 RepID=UPI002041659A|nr:ATP-binding protein [Rummeliibacillus stabekisii]MCM3317169.1 putative DNA binding domain-containing protein [Rummeliibacillus stabekisii]